MEDQINLDHIFQLSYVESNKRTNDKSSFHIQVKKNPNPLDLLDAFVDKIYSLPLSQVYPFLLFQIRPLEDVEDQNRLLKDIQLACYEYYSDHCEVSELDKNIFGISPLQEEKIRVLYDTINDSLKQIESSLKLEDSFQSEELTTRQKMLLLNEIEKLTGIDIHSKLAKELGEKVAYYVFSLLLDRDGKNIENLKIRRGKSYNLYHPKQAQILLDILEKCPQKKGMDLLTASIREELSSQ